MLRIYIVILIFFAFSMLLSVEKCDDADENRGFLSRLTTSSMASSLWTRELCLSMDLVDK